MRGWLRPLAVLAGFLVLAEAAGLVAATHRLVPTEVLVDALIRGGPDALFAIGLVLVYRASRVINFAMGAMVVGMISSARATFRPGRLLTSSSAMARPRQNSMAVPTRVSASVLRSRVVR